MSLIKLQPYITEKTLRLLRENKIYTFKGLVSYTKDQVKRYLEELYGVKVTKIRAVKIPGKRRFNYLKRVYYHTKPFKKFYVKFEKDVKIRGFTLK